MIPFTIKKFSWYPPQRKQLAFDSEWNYDTLRKQRILFLILVMTHHTPWYCHYQNNFFFVTYNDIFPKQHRSRFSQLGRVSDLRMCKCLQGSFWQNIFNGIWCFMKIFCHNSTKHSLGGGGARGGIYSPLKPHEELNQAQQIQLVFPL